MRCFRKASKMTDAPQLGDVWSFPFLWRRQERRGETEGRKYRPCAIVLLTRTERGQQEVLLVPITSQPSENNPLAVEVPEIEKKRAGLIMLSSLWVIVQEYNTDYPHISYYFEPSGRIGSFSSQFTKVIQRKLISAIQTRKARSVNRSDRGHQ